MKRLLLLTALVVSACASTSQPTTTAAAPKIVAPAFIEDDYADALREAKSSKRPLFIDAWAPWCHTCLSMRAYVFTDPRLSPQAKEFVWLSVDTEKPQNTSFLERYPMEVWPTLWVVDPQTEKPAMKWLGSATAAELGSLLDDAKAAVSHGDAGGEAGAAFLRGNQAAAGGDRGEAVRQYRAALAAAPADWPKRARVVEALAAQLDAQKDWPACVDLATTEMPRMTPGTSLANVALAGLDCAAHAPEGSAARGQVDALSASVERLATDRALPILADDRSGLFEALVDHYQAGGRATDARVLAFKWAEFLEDEARRAPTPAARAVFDAHRLLAYLAIGEPERALPMLAQSERDFPDDYNPPARIARAYLVLKRYDEALAAVDRALAHGYGPRKLRLFAMKADIAQAKGDSAVLAATLRDAIAYGKSLPERGRMAELQASLEKRLAEATTR